MASTATALPNLSKRAKVVARTELRDVPEGTTGRVTVVNGLTWIRYWVRFDNGVSLGSIDRAALATADEWKRFQAGEEGVFGDGPSTGGDAGAEGGDDAGDADAGGGKTTPNGTFVPQKFIDRAAAARARLQG